MDIKRKEGENEEQYIWRLGQAKDSGQLDMDWDEIAELINVEFRSDEDEYKSSSAYRKIYQYAKKMWESGVFNKLNESAYINELRSAKQEVRKEKQKLFDERTALNKSLRETARFEEDLSKLEALIKDNGRFAFPTYEHYTPTSHNDLVIMLSDLHLGATSNNFFGEYNSNIIAARLNQYIARIDEIQKTHMSENAYVLLGGDLISGNIHPTVQLENRENVIEQIQKAGEMISAFVYEISKRFKTVYVNGVSGNHSRLNKKDAVLRNERLDDLIPWYMEAKLSHINNVEFIFENNIDPTIAWIDIRDKNYLLVHGDYDSFSEAGVSKLVMMLGFKPEAIFYGHLHHCSYDDISDVKIVRSGSFCGTSDNFTVSKRIYGKPSQMVCVVGDDGIVACYPVELK